MVDKKKYKQDFKIIGKNTINNLQPVFKQNCSDMIDLFKSFINDIIDEKFDPKKKSKKGEKNDFNESKKTTSKE
jgi:hypothetical protein